jgi:hypothetical protein
MSPPRRWWATGALAAAVVATSVAVPPLIMWWPAATTRTAGPATSATPSAAASAPVSATPATTAPRPSATVASPPVEPPPAVTVPPKKPATTPGTAAPAPSFSPIRIAAADPGNGRDGVEVTTCATCASGRRVQYVGQGHSLTVNVHAVAVAGRRTLTVVYESGDTRTLDVTVNGGPVSSLTLSGAGNWSTPARTTLAIDLPAGDSRLVFFNATQPAPDLDEFLIDT